MSSHDCLKSHKPTAETFSIALVKSENGLTKESIGAAATGPLGAKAPHPPLSIAKPIITIGVSCGFLERRHGAAISLVLAAPRRQRQTRSIARLELTIGPKNGRSARKLGVVKTNSWRALEILKALSGSGGLQGATQGMTGKAPILLQLHSHIFCGGSAKVRRRFFCSRSCNCTHWHHLVPRPSDEHILLLAPRIENLVYEITDRTGRVIETCD